MTFEHELPTGFKLAGVSAGIKQASNCEDVSLFVSERAAVAAGMYTTNLVHASSIDWNRAITPTANCRGVVVNSGNSNACTGPRGERDTREMARLAADELATEPEQMLVLSTGIIGHFLPMDKIGFGIKAAAGQLNDDAASIRSAARGIMTTDTKQKIASRKIRLGDREVRVIGFAKGAGMIGPNMATMLCVLLTDAPLSPEQAAAVLKDAVELSFNSVSVDGHMSTSDAAILLASGDQRDPLGTENVEFFARGLSGVCTDLARLIAEDGEGASHLITIEVAGCQTAANARKIAKTIANSALVKTAIAGNDPNWGRIVSAAGYSGVIFDVAQCKLSVNGTAVFANAMPTDFDAAQLSQNMRENWETMIRIEFGEGDAGCRFWTSDLTAEYIRINADYHT